MTNAPETATRVRAVRTRLGAGLVATALAAGGLLVGTPAQAAPDVSTPLITSAGTTWSYSDTNTDPAAGSADRTSWTTAAVPGDWKSGTGSFGAKNGGKTGIGPHTANTLLAHYINGTSQPTIPAYFFRTTVNLSADQLAATRLFEAETLYDDALTVYVNGTKVAGFEDGDITSNMQYGGQPLQDPRTGSFTVPSSAFKAGANDIAIELHQVNATSSDIYFDFVSLTPVSTSAPATVSGVNLNVGADETQRNLAWYSNSGLPEVAQIAKAGGAAGDAFPVASARTVTPESGTATDGRAYAHATFAELEPATDYVYRVGSDEAGWSSTYTFSTGTPGDDYSFLFAGDAQIGASGNVQRDSDGWVDTLNKAEKAFPETEFLLSAGDQVESHSRENEYDGYLAPEQMTRIPMATNVGNHDNRSLAYRQHFNMPNIDETRGAAPAGESGGDYWFIYNDVLFMSINTNNRDNSDHGEFLKKVVEEHGDEARWKVVTFHHSIYSVASHATDSDIIARREALPPMISALGIDLVLMGHDHVYTRSYLMNGTTPVGTEEAVTGTVVPQDGDVLYVTANSASGSKYYNIRDQKFAWSAVQNQEYVPNITNIAVSDKAITATTYRTNDMSVVDEVRLENPDVIDPSRPGPAEDELLEATKTLSITDIDREAGTVTANVGTELAGKQLAFFAYSEPVALGAQTIAADGSATVTLPEGFEEGEHKLAAVTGSGAVAAWNEFVWPEAEGDADAATDADGAADADQGADSDAGADTGAGSDSDAAADAGSGSDSDAGTDSDAGADSGAGSGSDAGTDSDAGAATDAGSDADADQGAGSDQGSGAGADKGSDQGADGTVIVDHPVADPAGAKPSGLAATGADLGGLGAAVAALLALGVLLTVRARRVNS